MNEHHQKIEPTSDQRQLAKSIVGLYVALVQQGMTPDEALTFLARWAGAVKNDEED